MLKRPEDAHATFESLLKDPSAAAALDLVHYQYAEALARGKVYKRAVDHFMAVTQTQGGDANLATISLLRAAQLSDLAGDRKEAIAQYKAVLDRPNVYDTKQQAEKGLNRPFIFGLSHESVAPQDSRITSSQLRRMSRAGICGRSSRSSMTRRAVSPMSRQG